MLYLDYAREPGEWIPNRYGGREDLEAVEFLRKFNELVHAEAPGAVTIAEESTAWPGVSRPTYLGGLGFTFKWNMGWMHDMLRYFSNDPVHRPYHHNDITFSMIYAFTENFVLPISHDEVVYGKKALLAKMPGDYWQQFANARAFLAYMYGHPGKKLLFMGSEIGQWNEWNHDASVEWDLLGFESHARLQRCVRDLNRLYRQEPALWQVDHDWKGFQWIDCHDAQHSVIAFSRQAADGGDFLVFACNFTPVVRSGYRIGVPAAGFYREIFNSDSKLYGGSDLGNAGGVEAEAHPAHGRDCSIVITLPPLAVVVFKPGGTVEIDRGADSPAI
jgi:1,4-alpha-glucan branching enzyme